MKLTDAFRNFAKALSNVHSKILHGGPLKKTDVTTETETEDFSGKKISR